MTVELDRDGLWIGGGWRAGAGGRLAAEDPSTGACVGEIALGLYEPIHGSAPDIAGQGVANPLAAILSFAMCLKHSFGRSDLAETLDAAVRRTLSQGWRTPDIMSPGGRRVGTAEMTDAVLAALGA